MSAAEVTVVGAGVVGIATALALAERGAAVTVLERGPAPASGCSAGNAGVLGTKHVVPLPSAAALREGLRAIRHREGALGIDPRPAVLPWLARFALAATPRRHDAAARVLAELAAESAELHRALDERHGTSYRRAGFLTVFETEGALAAARLRLGAEDVALDGAATQEACPPLASAPTGAVLSHADAHCDPERLVAALAAAAVAAGAEIRTGVELLGLRRERGRVAALRTSAGELPAGEVVLATGAWAARLAPELPIAVPIEGGKGYHVDHELSWSGPERPVYFPERHLVVTPLGGELVRVSGMLQVCGTEMGVDGRRVDALLSQARELMPALADGRVRRVWRGLRPCTPDGLPMIGRVPSLANLSFAGGHGMWGLQLAPVTARLVADLLAGDADAERLRPLRPERFSWAVRRNN